MPLTTSDATRLRAAFAAQKLPTNLAELARRVRVGEDPAAIDRAMATTAASVVSKAPMLRAGPSQVKVLPDELVEATVHRAQRNDRGVDAEIDRVVTSRVGFFQIVKRYGALSDPQTESLAGLLASAARARLPSLAEDTALRAAEYTAYRTQRLVHLLRTSAGSERDALRRKLGTITPAASPVAPVNLTPTRYRQRDMKVGTLRIRYIDVNADSTEGTILLVHGHGSLLEEYEDLTPLLAQRYRVIVPDLPGCGYSDKPARRYTVGFYAKTLVAFLDALGVHRCVLAGGSLGGNLSLRLALEHPARFNRIVPWAPAGWIGKNDLLSFGARVARNMDPWVFWVSYHEQKGAWFSPEWPKRQEALKQSDLYRGEVYCSEYHHAYFDIAAEQTGKSWAPRAKEIAAHTLLMCGRHDDALDMWHWVSTVLATTMPKVTFKHEFEYGRHSIAAEDTKQLASYVLAHLSGPR